MEKKELKHLQRVFKKLTDIFISDADAPVTDLCWRDTQVEGIPDDTICYGKLTRGGIIPIKTFSPYEIEKLEYTKPGLFRKGSITVVGVDGTKLLEFRIKDKEYTKRAEQFNKCLVLYKQNNLGK